MNEKSPRVAVIAGAGPAGLTAALELLRRSDVIPFIFEQDTQVGGISKTVNYRGNLMDLGGHRFFSKSAWVMQWWQDILPLVGEQLDLDQGVQLRYQGRSTVVSPQSSRVNATDAVLLVRERLSRIYHRRRFLEYPLTLNASTLSTIGFTETLRSGISYGLSQLRPRPEKNLEDFFVNRFGRHLYETFFKDYTEKVWGVPCNTISAEWGAQRIKSLSIGKAVANAFRRQFKRTGDINQNGVETSLIERFLYPTKGPGQLWDAVAQKVTQRGGSVYLDHRVIGITTENDKVTAVRVLDQASGVARTVRCDEFVSTMPICELIRLLKPIDESINSVAAALPYRDFMTAGLLVKRMTVVSKSNRRTTENGMPPDNWIYIQDPTVKLGRLQIFNNWSPAMVVNPQTIWLGLEYFCSEGDALWNSTNSSFVDFAARELEFIGLIDRCDVMDATLVRVPKAYPAYFGEYVNFSRVRAYLKRYTNLFPIGRNGMHRYNNQDHSMLAARSAVSAMLDPRQNKDAIWDVNAEADYHEEPDHTYDGGYAEEIT